MLMHFRSVWIQPLSLTLRQGRTSPRRGGEWRRALDVQAQVVPEPRNRHGPNAVTVHVDGKHVATARVLTPSGTSEPFSNSTNEAVR